ncbi:MAG: hypothetical protein IID18_05610 [Nitrospinae bacterium]|nr:hypothetical protein [Nitrospinota bacterium]
MKRFLFYMIIFVFLAFTTPFAWSNPYLATEPPLSQRTNWDLTANGMLFVSYDLDYNGTADFHTLRVVVTSFFSDQTIQEVGVNFPSQLVFFVSYGQDRFYYVTVAQPLFYAVDVDEDGTWDLVYRDVSEDGVNGNETFYESPSGMFTGNIDSF